MRTQWTTKENRDAGSSCSCDRGLRRYLRNFGRGLNTPNPPSRYATAASVLFYSNTPLYTQYVREFTVYFRIKFHTLSSITSLLILIETKPKEHFLTVIKVLFYIQQKQVQTNAHVLLSYLFGETVEKNEELNTVLPADLTSMKQL